MIIKITNKEVIQYIKDNDYNIAISVASRLDRIVTLVKKYPVNIKVCLVIVTKEFYPKLVDMTNKEIFKTKEFAKMRSTYYNAKNNNLPGFISVQTENYSSVNNMKNDINKQFELQQIPLNDRNL